MYLYFHEKAAENAGTRLSDSEQETVTTECNTQLRWLGANPEASKTELAARLKDSQRVCQPSMMKLHGAGGGGTSFGRPNSGSPRVEEVD